MIFSIVLDALFFFLAFSALPLSIIYFIKSREPWILPYILIQIITTAYVFIDILFTGAGRFFPIGLGPSLFLILITLLRILLFILVPVFLYQLFRDSGWKTCVAAWLCLAGVCLLWFLGIIIRGADLSHSSAIYICVSAGSLLLAIYSIIIALRMKKELKGPMGVINVLFIFAGPVYAVYIATFTLFPIFNGSFLPFIGISFTNLCYGIWNLLFIRFLVEFIAIKPISAENSPHLDAFLSSADFTERERDILGRVIRGASNKEIGYDLSISEGTVKTHIFHAFRKAGVHTRVELMNLVFSALPGKNRKTEYSNKTR